MSLPPRGLYHAGFMYPAPPPTHGPPIYTTLMSHMGGKKLSLPSMSRVTETLGALGTLARRFLRGPGIEAESKSEDISQSPTHPTILMGGSDSHLSTASSNRVNVTTPVFKVRPEDDPELNQALYTLSRNVLGQVNSAW